MKKFSSLLVFIALVGTLVTTCGAIDYEIYGLDVAYATQEQIALYAQTYDLGVGKSPTYAVQPVYTAPYAAGVLSDETLTQAINTVNYVRYIVGLDWDVALDDRYNQYAAASAIVNYANAGLSHYPTQPEGMTYSLFSMGYAGSSSSNISSGHTSLYTNIIKGWMGDYSSEANLMAVGHRRWILSPSLQYTGFGVASTKSAMYVMHYANSSSTETTAIWPAQNTPTSVFASSYPWSYSQKSYITTSVATTVTLTRLSDGAVWNFDTANESATDGYITISNAGYGDLKGCLIFRPSNVSYADGDVFNVHIEGGVEANYFVTFFDESAVTVTTTDFTRIDTPATSDAYLYGASDWAVAEIQQAKESGLVSDAMSLLGNYQQNITREEFCTLALSLYQSLGGTLPTSYTDPFTDTDSTAVLQAFAVGIVTGTSDTTFSPTAEVTRQEIATMLYRLLSNFDVSSSQQDLTQFSDCTAIASWAFDGMATLNELGIINGTSTTTIGPLDNTSREQAILMVTRVEGALS